TWGSGTAGVSGIVSAINSLVGANPNEAISGRGVTVLPNGNYVVISPNGRGSVTWGSAASGVRGVVSEANSLVGTTANDRVGDDGILVLSNGNYLVRSSSWNGTFGAVTWASGATGIRGVVSAANSLVGSTANDRVGGSPGDVMPLGSGAYLVRSPLWNGFRGAV